MLPETEWHWRHHDAWKPYLPRSLNNAQFVMSKFEMNDQIIEAIEYAIFDSFDTQRGKATCKLVSSIRCFLREPSFPSTIVQCTDGTFSYLLANSDQHVPTQWHKYLISFCRLLSGSTCLLCSELVSYHRIGDTNECFDYQHSAIHCSILLELGSNNNDFHALSGVWSWPDAGLMSSWWLGHFEYLQCVWWNM